MLKFVYVVLGIFAYARVLLQFIYIAPYVVLVAITTLHTADHVFALIS